MEKRGVLIVALLLVVLSLYYISAELNDDELFGSEEPVPEEIPSSEPLLQEEAVIESTPEEETVSGNPTQNEPELTPPSEEPLIAPVQPLVDEEPELGTVDIEKEAGVTPDSPLWNVEVILDRMAMSLLINPSKIEFKHAERVARGLNVAEERLWEIQIMAQENDVRALAKASKEYQNIMKKIQKNINSLDEYDQEKSAVAVLRLNQEVQHHEQLLAETQDVINSNVKGGFTEKDQALFGSAIAGMQSSGQGFQSTFQQKKNRLVIVVEETPSVENNQVFIPEGPLPSPGPATVVPTPSPFTEGDAAAAKLKLAEIRSRRDLIFIKAQEVGFTIPSDQQQKIDLILQEAQLAYDNQQYGNVRELVGKATVLLDIVEENLAAVPQ